MRSITFFTVLFCFASNLVRGESTPATPVDAQPLTSLARRVFEATEFLGEPFSSEQKKAFEQAAAAADASQAAARIQEVLDQRALLVVTISADKSITVAAGAAKPELIEKGWRSFLVKIINSAGTNEELRIRSPQGERSYSPKTPDPIPDKERWLDATFFTRAPMQKTLSGLGVDYMLVSLYSRDGGKHDARFSFAVGGDDQNANYQGDCAISFTSSPAREITLRIRDDKGAPCTAALLIKDAAGHVYPAQAKRLAPDFWFQQQIYREEGEKIRLPDGDYMIEFSRGPESLKEVRKVTVNADLKELSFQVKRWIDAAAYGWISSDHHIHAAGCQHYSNPTEGVHAPDMARHCRGEDLKIGSNLTWGPCFDYQKQFFTGKDDKTSQWPYILRYDIEVSGFGSHVSGHLCLLGLKEQMYPGGDSSAHWPTLGLNTLKWAKKQGAICGPAHTGWGLKLPDDNLPNYNVPPMDGIGACETIADITHEVPGPDGKLVPAIDFISTCDTPTVWELNFWYHTLNAGFRARISGETDFPCIYGERVGMGRGYMKLKEKFTYEDWLEAIRIGRSYVGDGRSHFIEFAVNGLAPGDVSKKGQPESELRLAGKGNLEITTKFAAMLPEKPEKRDFPAWHLERARIGESREVPVELVVNGIAVARQNIVADGTLRDLKFSVPVERSSWVTLRVLHSSHTNPVFVMVGDKPIRASRKSIEWCLKAVDSCWHWKERAYADAEKADAIATYEHARQVYRTRLAEAEVD